MERSGITSKITGDNFRDYKKYLEIQKMNNGANNFANNNTNTLNNTNNNLNGNNITNLNLNQQTNPK